jgi:hypothetical protein
MKIYVCHGGRTERKSNSLCTDVSETKKKFEEYAQPVAFVWNVSIKVWLHTLLTFSCRCRNINHYIKLLIIVPVTERTGSIDLHHCVGGSHSGPTSIISSGGAVNLPLLPISGPSCKIWELNFTLESTRTTQTWPLQILY